MDISHFTKEQLASVIDRILASNLDYVIRNKKLFVFSCESSIEPIQD